MKDITIEQTAQTVRRLFLRARHVLSPARAILIECAFEGEADPAAARQLEALSVRVKRCAENAEPLEELGGVYVFADVGQDARLAPDVLELGVARGLLPETRYELIRRSVPGDCVTISVATLSADAVSFSDRAPSGFHPGGEIFVARTAELIFDAGDVLTKLAPIAVGLGLAASAEDARTLARRALFRPADRHSRDPVTAECERRILAAINRGAPEHLRLGTHTALTVSVEQTGFEYFSVALGGAFTSFAKADLSN
jgi:tartrate dehydratase alpha subunit/fumarate hydratase class I-like protein